MRNLVLWRRRQGELAELGEALCAELEWPGECTELWMPVGTSIAEEKVVSDRMRWLLAGYDRWIALGERVIVASAQAFGEKRRWGAVHPGRNMTSLGKEALESSSKIWSFESSRLGKVLLPPACLFANDPNFSATEPSIAWWPSDHSADDQQEFEMRIWQAEQRIGPIRRLEMDRIQDPRLREASLCYLPKSNLLHLLAAYRAGVPALVNTKSECAQWVAHGRSGLHYDDPQLLSSVISGAFQSELQLESMRFGTRVSLEEIEAELTPCKSAMVDF